MKKIKNNKDLYLKFYNYSDMISFGCLFIGIIWAVNKAYDIEMIIILICSLFGVCVLLMAILSKFYFYEHYLEIRFPVRFWSKGKKIAYDDILVVKEASFRYDRGFIIIPKGKFWKPEFGRPSNSFPCNRRKKREKLVEFLKSKNVEVEIT